MKTLLTSTALVAMLATSATANTLTSFGSIDHVGNTGDGDPQIDTVECVFVATSDGSMSYLENRDTTTGLPTGGGVWTLNNDATVELLVRNGYADAAGGDGDNPFDFRYALGEITVEPADSNNAANNGTVWEMGGTAHPATIDYDQANVVAQQPTGWNLTATVDSAASSPSEKLVIAATDTIRNSGIVKLTIGGTATLDDAILNANTTYTVTHKVTCMQNGTAGPWNNGVDTDTSN